MSLDRSDRSDVARDPSCRLLLVIGLLLVIAILSCEAVLRHLVGFPDPAGEVPLDVFWLLWMAVQGVLRIRWLLLSDPDRIPRARILGDRREVDGPRLRAISRHGQVNRHDRDGESGRSRGRLGPGGAFVLLGLVVLLAAVHALAVVYDRGKMKTETEAGVVE